MSGQDPTGNGRSILVVEDDEACRLLSREFLETAGFEVAEAEDGVEALDVFAERRPHLVLLDMCMPRMDGFEACRRIRALHDGAHVPVVVTTGLDDLESIERAFEAGATDFVTKPPNWTILVHRIRYMLRSADTVLALRRSEERIRFLAYHDGLTHLPNREFFAERLSRELAVVRRSGGVLAVLFLDLDGFKRINDTLGHRIGDRLLVEVAGRLRRCVRGSDEVARFESITREDDVARLGGDEFVLFLRDLSRAEDAARVARRIRESLEAKFRIDDHEVGIAASIGISLFPGDGDDVDALLRHADAAMYRAKEEGVGGYRFHDASTNASAFERLSMEAALRRALEQGELFLHFQPRVDVPERRVLGIEALVRWRHPEMGVLPASEFIDVVEDGGLLADLGAFVLREVVGQAAAWRAAGLPSLPVAVKVSSRNFLSLSLVEDVERALREGGLERGAIEIEIPERAVASAKPAITEKIERLRALGASITIEGFGTDASALGSLKKLPVDRVKLGRSLVENVAGDPSDAAIVSAIVTVARSLRLGVVAEGVEDARQLEVLEAQGCRVMQGLLFGRPATAEGIESLLRTGDGAMLLAGGERRPRA